MGILEFIFGILALGVAGALAVSVVGLAMLGLIIWGCVSVVGKLTGKNKQQQSIPSGAQRRDLPGETTERSSGRRTEVGTRVAARTADKAAGVQRQQNVTAPGMMRDYEYLDVNEGATAEKITNAMRGFEGAPYVGEYARAVISTLQKAEFRRKGLFSAINREFEANTITWDKFSAPVDVAMDGILRNCAQLANRVQGFDVAEYERLKRLVNAGACEKGSSKWERWKIYENTLAEMDEIQRDNEKLLFELEKLQDELGKLGGKNPGGTTDEIAEEIRRLSEDAKYYS